MNAIKKQFLLFFTSGNDDQNNQDTGRKTRSNSDPLPKDLFDRNTSVPLFEQKLTRLYKAIDLAG